MCLITIITPTYNRQKYLEKLYVSLKEQTCKDFRWLVVDDGSTDFTKDTIKRFQADAKLDFTLQYIYQKNGGKHTALNTGISQTETELTFIVDSDDYLPKESIRIIKEYHEKYKNQRECFSLCGYSFLRCHADGSVNTSYFPENEKIDSYRNVRINGNIGGDKAEVFYTEILKKYPFPVYEGERFLPEDIVWMQMSGPYNMVHINENIYTCDYLEGGLTNSGRKMKQNSPQGMVFRSKVYLDDKEVCLKVKVKMMLLYIIYGRFANVERKKLRQDIEQKVLFDCMYLPSMILKKALWKS